MPSDTTPSEEHPDPRDGTAVIPPVTDAMMDHAAHEAAALADGVAHHTIAHDDQAAATPAPSAEDEPSPVQDEPSPVQDEPSPAEPVRDAAEELVEAASDVPKAATRLADEAAAGAERVAEAARDASSGSADALSRYNAKMFEMMRANAASTTAHVAALVQAKSVPEALSLNADHLRRQMDALTSQGRELATLAQRIMLDAFQPFKGPTDR